MYSTPEAGSRRPSGETRSGVNVAPAGAGRRPVRAPDMLHRPVPELELEDVVRSIDRLPQVVDLRPACGTARSTQSSGRGILSSCAPATLCDDRAKLISPYAFQKSSAPPATMATVAAIAREEKRRNSSSAAEPSVSAISSTFAPAGVKPNARCRPGQDGEARRVEEGRDLHVVRRRRHEIQRERRRREECDQRRSPPLENQSRPDEEQRREIDEVPLDEARDAQGGDVSRLGGGVEAERDDHRDDK